MAAHTTIGASILGSNRSRLMQLAEEIALTHHERWEGGGYPIGLHHEIIPLSGRIVAVADVFDALTSARPYKLAWENERAYQLLKDGSGKHFDPACVAAFFGILDEVLEVKARYRDADMLLQEARAAEAA